MYSKNLNTFLTIYARRCPFSQKPKSVGIALPTSAASAIFLKVTYGYTVQEGKDPFIELADKAIGMILKITAPGAFLVDVIPARKDELRFPSSLVHGIYSTISPRMVPWHGILERCKGMSSAYDGHGSAASPICHGTRGRLAIAMPNPMYLMSREAAGTAIPSFSSRLLQGEVSSEEEDILMWTSANVNLGMCGHKSHFHLPISIVSQAQQTRYTLTSRWIEMP